MINEKKLLEKFVTIKAALSILVKECSEAEKELSDTRPVKKVEEKEWLNRIMMKRQKSKIRSAERKQLNNHY